MKKIFSVLLVLTLMSGLTVTASAQWEYTLDCDDISGWEYTDIPFIAGTLDEIFAGNLELFYDSDCTRRVSAALGTSPVKPGALFYTMEHDSGTVCAGYSCYIYANAVYATLFGDVPGRGWSDTWDHSETLLSGNSQLTYELFSEAGVRVGALLRTTTNKDGSFSGDYGHSVIILSYDEDGVTFLSGNGNSAGIVRVSSCAWSEFNSVLLYQRDRVLSFIVQPEESYYEYLKTVEFSVEVEYDDTSSTERPAEGWDELDNTDGTAPLSDEPSGDEDAEEITDSAVPNNGGLPEGEREEWSHEDVENGTDAAESEADVEEDKSAEHRLVGNFTLVQSYEGIFADVTEENWFYSGVSTTYELGLMEGRGDGCFVPDDCITTAEALTLTARMLSIYLGDDADFTCLPGDPWYTPYLDYCLMLGVNYEEYGELSEPITREAFARLCSTAVPEEALPEIREVAYGSILDVPVNAPYSDSVYLLYRAGILTGYDWQFYPYSTLTRAEAATIISRLADANLRIAEAYEGVFEYYDITKG